mmetsp:Transcript_18531/g.18611  ORF Transcript_18531/g.18611 Transcript_18531/m.18611 type:complete len:195 (+) Transcript_18531:311-895(+)|eukprot:CAMPEP_0182424386 /NCGR_PEP_ID=MMETSP1167-20130531/10611_1 /TAXON_ID=2988 /ORGANISM="Mallomonas Sp, Strain CCMP3275" /LENGTH=194 /DNA_ID=CAMNT_0024604185 /DNA_START=99 /DNA_END=683 /DNA_ORIENTATION=-
MGNAAFSKLPKSRVFAGNKSPQPLNRKRPVSRESNSEDQSEYKDDEGDDEDESGSGGGESGYDREEMTPDGEEPLEDQIIYNDPEMIIDTNYYDMDILKLRTLKASSKVERLNQKIQHDISNALSRVDESVGPDKQVNLDHAGEKYGVVLERYMTFQDNAVDIINIYNGNPHAETHNPENIRHTVDLNHNDDPY